MNIDNVAYRYQAVIERHQPQPSFELAIRIPPVVPWYVLRRRVRTRVRLYVYVYTLLRLQ
jgi:hypothetical protein